MPALVACGRIWEFGSDDLFYPAIFSTFIRSIWLLGLLGGVIYFREALGCESTHYVAGFSSALILVTVISILIEIGISLISARGTIIRVKPRKPIVHLLHIRVLVLIMEVVLLIIGTIFSFRSQAEKNSSDCPKFDIAVTLMQIIVAGYWFAFVLLMLFTAIYLDPCHCYSAKVNYSQVATRVKEGNVDKEVVEMQWRLSHTAWEKRFKVLFCLAGSDDTHQTAYREVAEIFAHYFCDTNVVMSDIVAGLMLLQKEHLAIEKARRKNSYKFNEESDEKVTFSFDFHHQEDKEIFKNAVYFMKYALGMYSWSIYVYMNPMCGLCRLCSNLNCCCGRRSMPPNVYNDNGCSCNLGGLRQITGINECDIIYASFESDVYKVPYTICLDHETKSVVIGFRGTLSLGDVVTDLTSSVDPMELTGFSDFLFHKGILKTVNSILKKLNKEDILEQAFSKVTGYKLVIVGHSLGAGCACIMSILLRERYPDLKCFCYSPTGALLNEAAAIFTEDFVTSVTLGEDFVARLNVCNAHKLKDDLVRVIESCTKPKCQILFEGCLETLTACCGASPVFREAATSGVARNEGMTNPRFPENSSRRVNGREDEISIHLEEEEDDDDESNPLLISAATDPEESLIPLSLSSRSIESSTPPQNASPFSGQNHPTDSLEVTPIFHPQLSSLKLPISSKTSTNDTSPGDSLTREVEQRLIPLFPPGKIIHIVDTGTSNQCFCGSKQLEVKWASRHDFNQIRVSPDMVRDHFPDVLFRAMKKIWDKKLADMENSEIRRHQLVP